MKNRILKISALMLVAIVVLTACMKKPGRFTGEKEDVPPDDFKPSTLEGLDAAEIEKYEKYKSDSEIAFTQYDDESGDAFEYSSVDGGVRIDGYVGEEEIIKIPSKIDGKEVVEINSLAFEGSSLRGVYVPDSVKHIGKGAFSDCTQIKLLRVPFVGDGADVTNAGFIFGADEYAQNAIKLPVSLEMIIIGDSAEKISERAFSGFKSLDAIVLGDGIKEIGSFAFYECEELTYIGFGEGLELIDRYAFAYCTSVVKLELPRSLESVELGAFMYCKSLCELQTPIIGDGGDNCYLGYMFGAQRVDWNENFVPNSLVKVTLMDNATRVENKAFANCKNLVQVDFSSNLEFIGIRAFYGCRSLASISTPMALKTISNDAFFGCDNLTSLTVEGATSIGSQAFFGCDKLTQKNISSTATVHENAFGE